jgi:hypothetical protein
MLTRKIKEEGARKSEGVAGHRKKAGHATV